MPDGAEHHAPVDATPETITVDDVVAACDGGGGALGHPRVFLRLVGGEAVCPYCSRRYLLRAGAGEGAQH